MKRTYSGKDDVNTKPAEKKFALSPKKDETYSYSGEDDIDTKPQEKKH